MAQQFQLGINAWYVPPNTWRLYCTVTGIIIYVYIRVNTTSIEVDGVCQVIRVNRRVVKCGERSKDNEINGLYD